MRGIRLNLSIGGTYDSTVGRLRSQTAAERIKGRNWHAQMYTSLAMISAIKDLVAASPVPVVFDHFGGIQAELGPQQPGFAELVELVRSGQAYGKISGAYRASTLAPAYGDVVPFVHAPRAATAARQRLGLRLSRGCWGRQAGERAPAPDAGLLKTPRGTPRFRTPAAAERVDAPAAHSRHVGAADMSPPPWRPFLRNCGRYGTRRN